MHVASPTDSSQSSPDTQPAISQPDQPSNFNFVTSSISLAPQPTQPLQVDQQLEFSTNRPVTTGAGASAQSAAPISTIPTSTTAPSLLAQPTSSEKRPSIGSIQFPTVTDDRSERELASTASFSTPAKEPYIPRQASLSPSAQPATQPQPPGFSVQPTPSAWIVQSGELAEQTPDQEQLLHDLVRLGLVQPDGIIDMFVSHKLSNIVRSVFDSFQQRRLDRRIGESVLFTDDVVVNINSYCSKVGLAAKVFHVMENHCRVTKITQASSKPKSTTCC